MGKPTTEAHFDLTATNSTHNAFGRLGDMFRRAKADADRFNQAQGLTARRSASFGGAAGRGGLSGALGGLGRFVAPAAAFAGVRQVMQMGDEIGDQADSMQVSGETFQTLKVLARDTAVSMGGLGKAFASLNEKKVEALADEASAAREAFNQLSLPKPLFAMNTEEIFEAVAATMRSTTATATELKAAQDLLGQSATKLGLVYQALAGTTLAELNKQMIESGRIVDEHGIKKISELESRYQGIMDRIGTFGMKGVVNAAENTKRLSNGSTSEYVQDLGAYYKALSDEQALKGKGIRSWMSRGIGTAFEIAGALSAPEKPKLARSFGGYEASGNLLAPENPSRDSGITSSDSTMWSGPDYRNTESLWPKQANMPEFVISPQPSRAFDMPVFERAREPYRPAAKESKDKAEEQIRAQKDANKLLERLLQSSQAIERRPLTGSVFQ